VLLAPTKGAKLLHDGTFAPADSQANDVIIVA
jgi:hypothetical protein